MEHRSVRGVPADWTIRKHKIREAIKENEYGESAVHAGRYVWH